MRTWCVCVAASLLVACGDDGGGGDDGGADAPPALRYPISFEVLGDMPLLIAVGDDDGSWTPVVPTADGEYTVQATNRHKIVTVCGGNGSFYTDIVLRTRFDDDPFMFCSNPGLPPQEFLVTGQMLQPGTIRMGSSSTDEGTTSPWTFDLSVAGGPHDLVAFGDTQVLLRRSVNVTAAATLPTIDLAEGAAYETVPVLLGSQESDETISTSLILFTGNDVTQYERPGTTLYELPSSIVGMNDFQGGRLEATSTTSHRTAPIDDTVATQTIMLMPRLTGITFTPTGATWTSLPLSTASIRLFVSALASYTSVEATGGYIAGATELAADFDIPGYQDEWRLTGSRASTFTALDDESRDTAAFSISTLAPRAQQVEASRRRMDRARRVRNGGAAAARAHR